MNEPDTALLVFGIVFAVCIVGIMVAMFLARTPLYPTDAEVQKKVTLLKKRGIKVTSKLVRELEEE